MHVNFKHHTGVHHCAHMLLITLPWAASLRDQLLCLMLYFSKPNFSKPFRVNTEYQFVIILFNLVVNESHTTHYNSGSHTFSFVPPKLQP